jgi:hypothetical protein
VTLEDAYNILDMEADADERVKLALRMGVKYGPPPEIEGCYKCGLLPMGYAYWPWCPKCAELTHYTLDPDLFPNAKLYESIYRDLRAEDTDQTLAHSAMLWLWNWDQWRQSGRPARSRAQIPMAGRTALEQEGVGQSMSGLRSMPPPLVNPVRDPKPEPKDDPPRFLLPGETVKDY